MLAVTVPPPSAPRGKRTTRELRLALRDAMTAEARAEASARIAAAVEALLAARCAPGATIGLYAGKGTEVDTAPLAAAAARLGFAVAYPRVQAGRRTLAFHAVAEDALEVVPPFRLREPRPDAPPVALEAIAAFVVPGLAFDRAGGRLGWGRGYYDATLAQVPAALRIGVAFECQLVERVPAEAHDISLHYIITEAATHAVG